MMKRTRLVLWVCMLCVALVAAACGPSTAVREGDDVLGGSGSSSESLELELPNDATWLAVEVLDDLVYAIGQPQDAQMVGSPTRYLIAFDAVSGNQRWRAEFNLPNSLPSYGYADLNATEKVIIFKSDNAIMGLSPKDGSVLWSIDPQNNQAVNPIGAHNNTLYGFSWPNTVHAYSLDDGSEVDSWTLSNYNSIYEAWLAADGKSVIATAEPTNSYGELALVVMDATAGAGGSTNELFRHPNGGGERYVVGPRYYTNAAYSANARSNHIVVVTTNYERVTLEGWSITSGEAVWDKEILLDPNTMYTSAYYAPRFLLTENFGLMQEPSSEGVLLRNVLRLHLSDLGSHTRRWTNVVPTQHYVDALLEFPNNRVMIHTRNDAQAERWYLFDAKAGDLVWSSRETEYVGSTRDMATNGTHMARLMTTDWVNSRMFVDTMTK